MTRSSRRRVTLPDVRRLAVLDMYGKSGSSLRRRLVRAEYVVAALECTVLGAMLLAGGRGWGAVLGAWLVGIGINCVPLALYAQALSKPGALEAEVERADLGGELRSAGPDQLWILVPLAVVLAVATRAFRGRRHPHAL